MLENEEILRKVFQGVSEIQLDINEIKKFEKSFSMRNDCDEAEETLQNVKTLLKSITGKVADINKYAQSCTTKDNNHNMQALFVCENGIGEEKESETVDNSNNHIRHSLDNNFSNKNENINQENSSNVSELTEENIQTEINTEPHVAKIKLKDITTLLDPSFLQKKNKMDKQEETVLVISDSDDEEPKMKKKNKKGGNDSDYERPKRKTRFSSKSQKKSDKFAELKERICKKKTKKIVDSDSESEEEYRSSKRNTRISKKKKQRSYSSSDSEQELRRKTRRNPKKKHTSDSSDSDQKANSKEHHNHKSATKKLPKDDLLVKTSSNSEKSESDSSDVENEKTKKAKSQKEKKHQKQIHDTTKYLENIQDKKFSWKSYVDLIRYAPERLKELYKKKTEAINIKKLSDLRNLKRKRKASESSTDSEEQIKKKKTQNGDITGKEKPIVSSDKSEDELSCAASDVETTETSPINEDLNVERDIMLLSNVGSGNEKEKADSDSDDSSEKKNENGSLVSENKKGDNTQKEVLDSNKDGETFEGESESEKRKENNENQQSTNREEGCENTQSNDDKENDENQQSSNHENDENQQSSNRESDENQQSSNRESDENQHASNREENDENSNDSSNRDNDNSQKEKESDKENTDKETENKENKEDAAKEQSDADDDNDAPQKESSGEAESSKDEKSKKESNWRKNKLLTEKLSDSDSDENFSQYMKKKTKMEENDDEAPLSHGKTKRKNKKRAKHVLGSDSDSDYKKVSDDSSAKSNDSESEKDDEEEEKIEKVKRRRIKKIKDSSDEDADKSTRKQIRKVWGKDSLSQSTIQAEKEEQERKNRILERQKKYNNIFEKDKLQNDSVDKVVLDFDEHTKEELLTVNEDLVNKLKPHQAKGIQFMFDACFESLERTKENSGSGCILAHCMGLGKTLQVISLSHTLLLNEKKTGVCKVLVVCPLSTVLNWVAEFKKWLPSEDDFEVFELVSFKQNYERHHQVKEWLRCGGVLIIGYDMFRNITNMANKRLPKKIRNTFQTAFVDPGPDLVVCDEGHLLKNEKTSISIAMNRIKTLRRIVLTGTPLQNNLKEYYCMVQFVRPNLLGTYKEYLNRFVNPITNGQYTDSTLRDISIMRKRSHVLHKMLDGIVQRKDYAVLAPFLPPKHEYVLFVSLTDIQNQLYEYYLKNKSQRNGTGGRTSFLFVDFQELQRICTHPRVLLDKSIEVKLAKEKKGLFTDEEDSEGSLKDFIDDDETEAKSTSSSSGSASENDEAPKITQKTRITRSNADQLVVVEEEEEAEAGGKEWWAQFCSGKELNNIAHSGKLMLLFEILKQCELIGDKILIFSQSLYSLNIIEYFLGKIDEATQDDKDFCGFKGSWALGLDYFRLDGSSSCDNRAANCKTFNNEENHRARLFLISTRAGGLGINLVAANRVIIFDVSWNPSHDIQSIYRIYRFGQTKPCYVYRFVTMGAMEMKIYERQVTKQAISKRVIDEQQIDRHYNQTDLNELYNFDPNPCEKPVPLVPKDILLAEMFQNHEKLIFKYHEHQSLLENKEDEVLNEEERKAAWEEFQNEKTMQQYAGFINHIPMASITAAITSIVKKDNPTWPPEEVNKMIPALVAKLQEDMAAGDNTMYNRILAEIKLIQVTNQQQRIQEYYNQQQQQHAMKMLQYQQMIQKNPGLSNINPMYFQQLNRFSQSTSGRSNQQMNPRRGANMQTNIVNSNPIEIVDLND